MCHAISLAEYYGALHLTFLRGAPSYKYFGALPLLKSSWQLIVSHFLLLSF
mgnify:CR=1 FL=1